MPSRLALEVIVTSREEAEAAEAGGADRLELVRDLHRGGFTPPTETIESVAGRVQIPVRVMIRETASHEIRDASVFRRLIDQARAVGRLPIDGIVVGFVENRHVDRARLVEVLEASLGKRATFHRAFETLTDQYTALKELAGVPGVDRVLTSGAPGEWPERADRLTRLARAGAPGIAILVGGGITARQLPDVARIPGIQEVHVGRAAREPPTDDGIVRTELVARLIEQLKILAR
jgi:copper homeostasis protein